MSDHPLERLDATVYLAPRGFEAQLLGEIRRVLNVHGRLVLAAGTRQPALWAQNVWLAPVRFRIDSVAGAARKLRSIQRNWALHSTASHRRAALIQAQLPHVSARPLAFPAPPPEAPLGSWTLLDRDTVLASAATTSPFPDGEARFKEFKVGPPARAYLKLWEALTLLGRHPRAGELCLDAGASPGSWTWALARLGARVIAVDRSPLAPGIARLPTVEYRKASAFSLQPRAGPFAWIVSDIACYPERLWEWVRRWLASGQCRNFICTLKFQGTAHYGAARSFAAVPGSRLVHLFHNKHELTWMFSADG